MPTEGCSSIRLTPIPRAAGLFADTYLSTIRLAIMCSAVPATTVPAMGAHIGRLRYLHPWSCRSMRGVVAEASFRYYVKRKQPP